MNHRFSKEYIEALAHKYMNGKLTSAEEADFEAWYNSHRDDSFVHGDAGSPDSAMKRIYQHIQHGTRSSTTRKMRRWLPYVAAVFLVTSVVGYFVVGSRYTSVNSIALADILPGGNKATLTLANGHTISLSEAQNGIIVQDEITYVDGSAVLSESLSEGIGDDTHTLVLTTPKGGTYTVTLPDGSRVWLNAASTLTYPSRFSGDLREVFLEGEAFFAVNHQPSASGAGETSRHSRHSNRRLPFRVVTRGQTVEVLGTQFNISAYLNNTETKTTLVEGRVQVEANGERLQLVPGEQGTSNDRTLTKNNVDTEPFTAWKEGLFYFDNIPAGQAIEQIARWYDLDIIYDGNTPETIVFGMIDREKPLSAVLRSLGKSGLNFKISSSDGKKQLHISGKR